MVARADHAVDAAVVGLLRGRARTAGGRAGGVDPSAGEAEGARAATAARRLPAGGAGQPRDVARARRLYQHRTAGSEGGAGRLERRGGEPGGAGQRVAGELEIALALREDARHRGADGRTVGDDLAGPPRLDQQLPLGGARVPGDEQRRADGVGAQDEHVADVRVGGAGFGVQVVAVVPDDEQAGRGDRGERRRTGADDDPDRPPAHREPPAVALGRPEVGGQHHDRLRAETDGAGSVEEIDVTLVGHDEQRATPRARGGVRGVGQPLGPGLTRQGLPDGVRGPALTQRAQERLATWVATPADPPTVDGDPATACRAPAVRRRVAPRSRGIRHVACSRSRDGSPCRRSPRHCRRGDPRLRGRRGGGGRVRDLGTARRRCRCRRGGRRGAGGHVHDLGTACHRCHGRRRSGRRRGGRLHDWVPPPPRPAPGSPRPRRARAAAARPGGGHRPAHRRSGRPRPGTARRSRAAGPARWRPPSPARRGARRARMTRPVRARTRRRGGPRTGPAPAPRCPPRRRGVPGRRSRRGGRGGPTGRRQPPWPPAMWRPGATPPCCALPFGRPRHPSSPAQAAGRPVYQTAPQPTHTTAPRTTAGGGDTTALCARPPTLSGRPFPGTPLRRRGAVPASRTRRTEMPNSPYRKRRLAVGVSRLPGTSARRRGRSTPTAARRRCGRSARTPPSARRSGAAGRGRG